MKTGLGIPFLIVLFILIFLIYYLLSHHLLHETFMSSTPAQLSDLQNQIEALENNYTKCCVGYHQPHNPDEFNFRL